MIMHDFQTVCSWVQFKNDVEWKYDLMLSTKLVKLCREQLTHIKTEAYQSIPSTLSNMDRHLLRQMFIR